MWTAHEEKLTWWWGTVEKDAQLLYAKQIQIKGRLHHDLFRMFIEEEFCVLSGSPGQECRSQ